MQAFNLIKGLEKFTAKLTQKISSQMPCANTSAILLQTEVSDQTTPVKEWRILLRHISWQRFHVGCKGNPGRSQEETKPAQEPEKPRGKPKQEAMLQDETLVQVSKEY